MKTAELYPQSGYAHRQIQFAGSAMLNLCPSSFSLLSTGLKLVIWFCFQAKL